MILPLVIIIIINKKGLKFWKMIFSIRSSSGYCYLLINLSATLSAKASERFLYCTFNIALKSDDVAVAFYMLFGPLSIYQFTS